MYNLLGLGGKGNLHASAFLVLAVLWMIQLFVTDSEDSCFLSVSIELRHADLLACMRGKIHFLVILSNMKAWIKCLVFWNANISGHWHFWTILLNYWETLVTKIFPEGKRRLRKSMMILYITILQVSEVVKKGELYRSSSIMIMTRKMQLILSV